MNLTAVTLPVVMGLKLQQQAFTCTQKMWRWMHMIVCLMIFPLFSLAPVAQAATPFSVDPYALQFDGVNDFVRVPSFGTFTTTFSTSAWIHRTGASTAPRETVISYKEGTLPDCGFVLSLNETGSGQRPRLFVDVNGVWDWAEGTSPIPINQDVHLSGSYDGITIKLYVNGILVASKASAGAMLQCTQVTGIGGRATEITGMSNNSTWFFPGKIDEVRIWNTARTQAQIQADMYSRLTVNEAGLVGYWRFDEGSGTTVADTSGNGNNGILGAGVAANRPMWTRTSRPYAPPVLHVPLDGNANDVSGNGLNGTATAMTYAAGAVGQAGVFDGVSSFIDIADHSLLDLTNSITMAAWVKTTSTINGIEIILNKEAAVSSPISYEMGISDGVVGIPRGNLAYYLGERGLPNNGAGWTDSLINIPTGVWTHVAIVATPRSVTSYVNGVATSTFPVLWGVMANTTGPLRIGARSGSRAFFSGQIDDVRLYNRALSSSEINRLNSTTSNALNVASASNGSTATAISAGTYLGINHPASFAIDGNSSSYWASQWSMPAWIQVTFNQVYTINKVGLWLNAHQHTYAIKLSMDGANWTTVVPPHLSQNAEGATPSHETINITPTAARYMRVDISTTSAPATHIFQAALSEVEAFRQRTNTGGSTTTNAITFQKLSLQTNPRSPLLSMRFHATRNNYSAVSNLTTDDFIVLEDGIQKTSIETFFEVQRRGELNFKNQTLLMLDVSSSLNSVKLAQLRQAAKGVIMDAAGNSLLLDEQEVAVYVFDGAAHPRMIQNFTRDPHLLTAAINRVSRTVNSVNAASTNLYGAIRDGMAKLSGGYTSTNMVQGQMILITDGKDTAGLATEAQAQASIGGNKLYTIAIAGGDLTAAARSSLQRLSSSYANIINYAGVSTALQNMYNEMNDIANSFYQLNYKTTLRSGIHRVELRLKSAPNTATPINGAFTLTPPLIAIPSKVSIVGNNMVAPGHSIMLHATTKMSPVDPYAYRWASNSTANLSFNYTPTVETRNVNFLAATAAAGRSVTVTAGDTTFIPNLTASKKIFIANIGLRGVLGDGVVKVENQPLAIQAIKLQGTNSPRYSWSIANTGIATLNYSIGSNVNITGLSNGTTTLTLRDTANATMQTFMVKVSMNKVVYHGDFNGDGKADVLFHQPSTGKNFVMLMNGKRPIAMGFVKRLATSWSIASTADFNGDGKSDILFHQATTGKNFMMFMNGTRVVAMGFVKRLATSWAFAATADFNGDGKADILFHQATTGKNFMMLMNGKRVVGMGFMKRLATSWTIVATADFNGDGKSDILFHQAVTGKNFMMLMNGKRLLAGGMGFVKRLTTSWSIAGTGDFNGDGKADILFHQASTGKNFMMLMKGKRPLAAGVGFVKRLATSWSIAGTGDFNGDGKADILFHQASTGKNFMMLMNGKTPLRGGMGFMRRLAPSWQISG